MESFIKKILEGRPCESCHEYFVRFGKGKYERRFIIRVNVGKKIKIRGSFEWANDFVKFVNENKNLKFSGKILMKKEISGMKGKKKAGSFVYEVLETSLEKFENAYFYLLDVDEDDVALKIKKNLPKPGKNANKIDDKFCSLDLDLKYWPKFKEAFFWDIEEEIKKIKTSHDVLIEEIIFPAGEDDPIKIRALAKRKGKIIRKIEMNKKEFSKTFKFEA